MPIVRRFREQRASLENPQIPISSATIAEYFGGTPTVSGATVNEKTAMKLVAVFRCVELVAGTCAALPLKAYKKGTRERQPALVLEDPHPELTAFETWEIAYACLLLWGNAYFRKLRDGTGRIRYLWPIHPGRVDPQFVDATPTNPGGKVFVIADKNGTPQPYTSFEILHIPGLGYDGLKGLSRIQLAKQGLGVGLAAEEYAARWFGSGTHLSGIITAETAIDEDTADRIKKRWKEKVGGLKKAHDIAVLGGGAQFQAISIPAKDAELLASREYGTTEIARLFGLPPYAIGDVEKSTSWGTGIEQQKIGLVQFTLQPSYLTRIEQRLTKEVLLSDSYAEYTVEGLLRGDSAARAEFYAKAIQNGWMSRNGARVRENEEPIEGGDEMLLPAGVLPSAVSEMKVKVEAAGALVRAGYDPAESLAAVGLDPIKHSGLFPVTVQSEEQLSVGGQDGSQAA